MYNGHTYTDTLLHMDITDAINISVYMEGRGEESEWWKDGQGPHALWLLWRRDDIEPLRQFLREYFGLDPNIDPINSGDLRITPRMLEGFKSHKIEPYIIRQGVGQAVVIPALTPHYVRLDTDRSLVKVKGN